MRPQYVQGCSVVLMRNTGWNSQKQSSLHWVIKFLYFQVGPQLFWNPLFTLWQNLLRTFCLYSCRKRHGSNAVLHEVPRRRMERSPKLLQEWLTAAAQNIFFHISYRRVNLTFLLDTFWTLAILFVKSSLYHSLQGDWRFPYLDHS